MELSIISGGGGGERVNWDTLFKEIVFESTFFPIWECKQWNYAVFRSYKICDKTRFIA